MNTKTILIGLVVIAVGAFGVQSVMNNSKAKNTTGGIAPTKVSINDVGVFNSTDRASAVAQFAGKPTIIFIVGTFCPHCQAAMPTYKTDIWDVYKDTVNIFANVTDGQGGKRFEVAEIPQGVDTKLDFKTLVGEECNYVPSWVLLDTTGKTVDNSCGAAKNIDIIKAGLDAQIAN